MMSRLIVAEPVSAYERRPPLVIDASVLAAALFAEPGQDEALAWMRGRALCAPHLIDCEIASVAIRKLRLRTVPEAGAETILGAFGQLDLERFAVDAAALAQLATRHRITAHDAAYLWLAAELQAPLATFDAKLGAAARAHLA
ncbi:MAG: type II toxin-antitoxin system VapC family toxin [Burkholderiales bacterium]|nr:MAG: type II toxin-antitoxin system VapC family toxin [Burkholderiales bacterium]